MDFEPKAVLLFYSRFKNGTKLFFNTEKSVLILKRNLFLEN